MGSTDPALGVDDDGTGWVQGFTPGYHGDHDLGLAYHVTAVDRKPAHDCGLCDKPIVWIGDEDGVPAWRCETCGWEHTSKDCCEHTAGEVQ